jgi:hypothetical protein
VNTTSVTTPVVNPNAPPPPIPGSAQLPFYVLNFPLTSDHVEDYGGVNGTLSPSNNGVLMHPTLVSLSTPNNNSNNTSMASNLDRSSSRRSATATSVSSANGGGGSMSGTGASPANGAIMPRKTIFGGNGVVKKIDEMSPTSFVEVSIED